MCLGPHALALVLSLCGAAAACGADAAKPPNVVLITLDTTRADYLSCYGSSRAKTPHLDALAAEGTRFDLAAATASVTPVAHAAILTGLYNHEHGLRVLYAGGGYRLGDEPQTLATVLAARGYHTLAVHSAFPVSRFFGFDRGFEVFEDMHGEPAGGRAGTFRWDVNTLQRRSDETTELASARLGKEPFFLWVHYWDPHDAVRVPPGLESDEPRSAQDGGVQRLYAEEVEYMDAEIGRLFAALRERGLYDDTLIVVVADHGQGLMDHGWPSHRILYQEQMRVPLIVRLPGERRVPVVSELVRTVDIYPTVLDYAGIEPPVPVSGRSLRALLEGAADEPRIAFADQINGYDWNAGAVTKSLRDDFLYVTMDRDWKLIYRPRHFADSELYNISADPREERDLFEAEPARAQALLARLAEEAPWVTAPFEAPAVLDDDVQRQLSELGYTGSETVDTSWEWTCPAHLTERWPERKPCPTCGGAPLLIGR